MGYSGGDTGYYPGRSGSNDRSRLFELYNRGGWRVVSTERATLTGAVPVPDERERSSE